MKFFIKKIGNWISVDKNLSASKTILPFGLTAVVKNGTNLTFTKRRMLC